jgi:hypothetical protein
MSEAPEDKIVRAAFPKTSAPRSLEGGNGGPHPPDMSMLGERVARMEGAVEGLKSSVDAMRWVVGVLAVIIVGGVSFLGVQITRSDGRIAALETKVDALPDKINANLQALTQTLANAITAAKQQPPQVILLPAPPPQQK